MEPRRIDPRTDRPTPGGGEGTGRAIVIEPHVRGRAPRADSREALALRSPAAKLDEGAQWVLEIEGTVIATGGLLYHYNRPYGDIYMAVAEAHRRRGLGAYLVQELTRVFGTLSDAFIGVQR